jgi:hypothetical protein
MGWIPVCCEGQALLNPSFENVNSPLCAYNLSNANFNSVTLNVTAFGSYENCDIVHSSCGYGAAHHGDWFIGLSVPPGGGVSDAVAMEVSPPLQPGLTYQLTFYHKKDAGYDANEMEVGFSTSPVMQGTVAGTVAAPASTGWAPASVFISPNTAAAYITLNAVATQYGWNHIDDFSLTQVSAAASPSSTQLPVWAGFEQAGGVIAVGGWPAGTATVHLEIHSAHGRLLLSEKFRNVPERIFIPAGRWAPGLYLLTVHSPAGGAVRKVVKN